MPSVITCLVAKRLGNRYTDNHWELRNFTANLVSSICKRWRFSLNLFLCLRQMHMHYAINVMLCNECIWKLLSKICVHQYEESWLLVSIWFIMFHSLNNGKSCPYCRKVILVMYSYSYRAKGGHMFSFLDEYVNTFTIVHYSRAPFSKTRPMFRQTWSGT